MKKMIGMLLVCSASLALNGASAHGTPSPNHGGIVMAVGETWLELVANADSLDLYLEDDGEALDSAGITGKVTIVNGAIKKEYVLTPAGGNRLEAKGAQARKGAKVITLLMLADHKTRVPATFVIK